MGIHSGPKNGDFASYIQLLTDGEPGRVIRGKSARAAAALEADVPDVPNGFNTAGDPLGAAADMDAARDTRDMLRAERELQAIRAQHAPSAGTLNDMTFGRQSDHSSTQSGFTFPADPQTPAGQPISHHPGQGTVANVQRAVGLFFSIVGYVIVFSGILAIVTSLFASSDMFAGVIPGVFLVVFGSVLIRISRGVRRQAITPRGVMPPLTTVSSRTTQP